MRQTSSGRTAWARRIVSTPGSEKPKCLTLPFCDQLLDRARPRLVKKPVGRPASCSTSKLLGRYSLIQRSPGHVTADQNTTWHTTLRTPDGTIISHVPELSQNHAVAPEPSIRLSRLSAKITGTVLMWPPFPTRSTIAQCSSRRCKCANSKSAKFSVSAHSQVGELGHALCGGHSPTALAKWKR
jgi:hypothetical protein